MKKVWQLVLVTGIAGVATSIMSAAGCPDLGQCETSKDCPTTDAPICDRGTCKASCEKDTSQCTGTTPVCYNDQQNKGGADNKDLIGVCVCSATSCPTGQACDKATGDCKVGSAEGEGEGEGAVAECDGIDDPKCTDKQELCDLDATCQDPDTVTSNCTEANLFTTARENNGPLIYDLTYHRDTTKDAPCNTANPGSTAYGFELTYFDPDSDFFVIPPQAPLYSVIKFGPDANNKTNNTALPVETATGSTAKQGAVKAWLCLKQSPVAIAVQVQDTKGHESNVACVQPTQ